MLALLNSEKLLSFSGPEHNYPSTVLKVWPLREILCIFGQSSVY